MAQDAEGSPGLAVEMPHGRLRQYINEEIAVDALLEVQLIALTFAVGINDAATFTDFHTFVSNQTGSTVFLAIGALGVTRGVINIRHVALSLGGYVSGCILSGRLMNHFGSKKRGWLLTTNTIQTATMYVAAALRRWYLRNTVDSRAYAVIFLLSFGAGLQVSVARAVNIAELPTGMITTGYTDFFNDPDCLRLHNRKRDRRFCSVFSLLIGAFVGAAALKYEDTALSILIAAIVKTMVTCSFFFNKPAAKKQDEAVSESEAQKQGA